MRNFYVDYLQRILAIAQNPERLWKDPSKDDVQLVVYVVASLLLCLVFGLIIATDAKFNGPPPAVDDEDESKNIDYRRMLEQATASDILSGSTDRYDWQQSAAEVDVFVHLRCNDPVSLRSKEIKVDITAKALTVTIRGDLALQGEFYAEVLPAESNWQMDEADDGTRRLWITVVKRTKTARASHWACFLRGDPTVDTKKLGPQAIALDASDPASVKRAVANLRQRIKDRNENK